MSAPPVLPTLVPTPATVGPAVVLQLGLPAVPLEAGDPHRLRRTNQGTTRGTTERSSMRRPRDHRQPGTGLAHAAGDTPERPDGSHEAAMPVDRSELAIASTPASVAVARAVIRDVLRTAAPEQAESAAVCGSELVANAVRHGSPPIHLSVQFRADKVLVVVQDGNRTPPLPRVAGSTDQGGRGTMIVERLADRWGVEFLPDGKQVWCRFDRGPARR